jgi:hypoxanthine phosphoribosyltransferase
MPSGAHNEYSHGPTEADYVYRNIIEPAVRKAFNGHVKVIREMDNREPGSITRNIVHRTATCDIVVVDITGQNPNVFFELGIRYSLRKKTTILLRQTGVTIPFDIHHFRCVDYSPFSQDSAIHDISATIEAAQKSVGGSDSLVYEVFPQLTVRGLPDVEPEEGSEDAGQMPWIEYWRRVEDITRFIHDDRASRRYAPAIIVGISNGGMIFADLLARRFQGFVPVVGLWANRKSKKYFESDINKQLLIGVKSTISTNDELLLVDDIVASGTTVSQAIDFIKDHLPEASISFLPMFNRNVQYADAIKDVLLWNKPPFRDNPEEARRVSGTNWTKLPYLKDIRSA